MATVPCNEFSLAHSIKSVTIVCIDIYSYFFTDMWDTLMYKQYKQQRSKGGSLRDSHFIFSVLDLVKTTNFDLSAQNGSAPLNMTI